MDSPAAQLKTLCRQSAGEYLKDLGTILEMGKPVTFHSGDGSAHAFLALPSSESGPGLLLLHAWWGLTREIQRLADDFAAEGFVVLAPDYYEGATAESIEEATAIRSKVDRKSVNGLVKDALGYLLGLPQVDGEVASAAGLSLGCGFAIEISRARPDHIGAVVLFYGTGGGKFDRVKASFQGHFAEDDQWGAGSKKVQSLEKRLEASGVDFEFHTYPGTQHWFFERDGTETYDGAAAEMAWQRTVNFLRQAARG